MNMIFDFLLIIDTKFLCDCMMENVKLVKVDHEYNMMIDWGKWAFEVCLECKKFTNSSPCLIVLAENMRS